MTQTLIEQLEKLQLYWPGNRGEMYPAMTKEGSRPRYVGAEDLRAIIEQHKREVAEAVVIEPYYFIKLIGETDWYECTKTQYLRAINLPEYDYKMSEIYDDELNPLYGFDVYKQTQNNLSVPANPDIVAELVNALSDDAYAASFQSMAGYRTALIAKVKGVMG